MSGRCSYHRVSPNKITIGAGQTRKVDTKKAIAFSIENVGDNSVYVNWMEGATDTTTEIRAGETRGYGEIIDSLYAEELYLYAAAVSTAVVQIYFEAKPD